MSVAPALETISINVYCIFVYLGCVSSEDEQGCTYTLLPNLRAGGQGQ